MPILESIDNVRRVLTTSRTIAVLGAHREEQRAAFYVPEYLHEHGYRILPVNPKLAGTTLWGEPVRSTLAELAEPVDMIDVFRRPSALPDHVDDILAMWPRPATVWFQLGIRNDAVAARLAAEGLDVVQDRCTLADHEHLGL
jgi:hypothetical protein